MALEYGLLTNILLDLNLGLDNTLIPILIIGVSAITITRNTRQLRLLLLPLSVGYSRIGLSIHPAIIATLAITWGVTLVGASVVGSTLSSLGSNLTRTIEASTSFRARRRKNELLQTLAINERTEPLELDAFKKELKKQTIQKIIESKEAPIRKRLTFLDDIEKKVLENQANSIAKARANEATLLFTADEEEKLKKNRPGRLTETIIEQL